MSSSRSALRPLLRGALGEPYLYFAETGSTQDVLRDGDHPHGAVAVAEHQTAAAAARAGAGTTHRRRRSSSPCCCGRRPTRRLPQLSLVAGLAVAAALERGGRGADAREVAERRPRRRGARWRGSCSRRPAARVVCGIGINVNQEERDLPAETRIPATSLRIAAGRAVRPRPRARGGARRARAPLRGLARRRPGRARRRARGAQRAPRQPRPRRRPRRHGGADRARTAGSRSCSTAATGCSSRAARWSGA